MSFTSDIKQVCISLYTRLTIPVSSRVAFSDVFFEKKCVLHFYVDFEI